MRRCIECQQEKPLTSEFWHKASNNSEGFHVRCKPCRTEQQRQYRAKNREKQTLKNRERARRPDVRKRASASRYKTTVEHIMSFYDGQCSICKANLDWATTIRKEQPCVDHCHQSGEIRGILCCSCNAGLGQFKDSPDMLSEAIKYLKRDIS